ncbi:MAG: Uma2 family endonuclease [Opitutus sp.]|nr:Uma2 family endonuclease [Opitutus sp.]
MDTLTIELPRQSMQPDFNLRRWAELVADPKWIKVEGRVETDRHGHVLMSPPPAASHGGYQSRITVLLDRLMPDGEVFTECPISTADGVRTADVAWASRDGLRELGDGICFPRAPEICVEVLSPDNTAAEMREKSALYFDAGAREVWHCSQMGQMTFFGAGQTRPLLTSILCPDFPALVRRR